MNNPLSLERLTNIFRTNPKDASRIINREGTTIEFKESYNHGSMAQYLKTIASFANNIGGYIIFGVGEKPRRLIGLKDKSLLQFEEIKVEDLTKLLLDYFSPEIKWDHITFEFRDMSFGVIYVFPLIKKPCICKKHYDDKNTKSTLKEGDIYYRYGGRSERIHYTELNEIIEATRRAEEKQWLDFIKETTQIGISNAGLLDLESGKISGNGGAVILDDNLLQKISFIREGEFVESKGKPTLRLIGDVQELGSGKVVVSETTRKVIKAIEPTDIVKAFLNNDTVEQPLEYIKRICSATSAYFPIYFYIKQSNLTITEVIEIIENTIARGKTKTKLLERLSGKTIQIKNYLNKNISTEASKNKIKYKEQWLSENVDNPIDKIDYALQAILFLTNEEIFEHQQYICSTMNEIFLTYYENATSITANYIRTAICRIDEAINLS